MSSNSTSKLPRPEMLTESSGTLNRHKSASWSFPKAQRFLQSSQIVDVPYLNLPSTLEQRFTTMGKGGRYSAMLNDNPPPDFYNVPSQFDPYSKKKGTVFGPLPRNSLGISFLEGIITSDNQIVAINKKNIIVPGPGAYNLAKGFIASNKGVKLKSRKVIHNKVLDNPAPSNYNISEKLSCLI